MGIIKEILTKADQNTGHPTKKEYEENIRQINEKELHSATFKFTRAFLSILNERENLELEERLFEIVGASGREEDLFGKSYDEKKISKLKRYSKLTHFMNSLTQEQIHSNPYLQAAVGFMEKSLIDCRMILEHLQDKIKENSDDKGKFDINMDIPSDRLYLFPLTILEQTSIPYYKPQDYRKSYIYLLDKDNRYVYEEYNKYVRTIEKLAEDIYHLQMWNLLSEYPEQIDNYYFYILNNESEHQFRTSYSVKKCIESHIEEKKEIYQISEETKSIISRIFGLPFEEIIKMDPDILEKYVEERFVIKQIEINQINTEETPTGAKLVFDKKNNKKAEKKSK